MKKLFVIASIALGAFTTLAFSSGEEPAVTTVMSIEVKDYNTWKQSFDAAKPGRDKAGIKVYGIFSAIDNPNKVTVISEIPDMELANKYLSNPELKASMEKAGVISKPELRMLKRL